MIRTVSFYDPATGLLTGRTFSGPEDMVSANTPEGLAAIDGHHDHLAARVVDGAVVDWIPDAPDAGHEWSRDRKRWLKVPALLEAEASHAAALGRIDMLERSQFRAIRELALDPDHPVARDRLLTIDAEIATLRASLKTTKGPT